MKLNEKYNVNFTEKNEDIKRAIGNVTTESELQIVNTLVEELKKMESVETIYCYYLYDVHEWVLKLNVIASGDLDRVNDYIKATERDLCWHVYHPFFKYHISALSLEDMINLSRENKIAYLKELCNRIHDRSLNFLLDRHGYFYNLAAETYCKTDTIDDFKRLGELDTEKEAISVLGRKFTPNKQD